MEFPAPTTAQELAEMWGNSEQEGATGTPTEPAASFFPTLRRALHHWGLAEAQYKSDTTESAGMPDSPRQLLLQAVRQIMEGAQRGAYWGVYASRQAINRLLSLELDSDEVIAAIAERKTPIKDRAKYVYRHWRQRLQQPDNPARAVTMSGVPFLARIVCYRYRHGRAVAALLIRDGETVFPHPDCALTHVDLVTLPADAPTVPPSEVVFGAALIRSRRECGDDWTVQQLRKLADRLNIPRTVEIQLRFMGIARRLVKKRRARSLKELALQTAAESVAMTTTVHTDGSLAIAGDGGVGEPPTVGEVLAELADSSRAEASEAADRLLAYAGTFAPKPLLESQWRTFKRLFDQGGSVMDPLIHELAERGHVSNVETWAIDARNEWLSHELERERAANNGQGPSPDVERAVRRNRTPRTPSLLEQQTLRAVARGSATSTLNTLRNDLEAWLRILNDRQLDVSVEKRIEQELFVRMKLWNAFSRVADTDARFDIASEPPSESCMKYLIKNEGRLLAALYRVLPLIQVPDGFPRYSKRWIRERRKAPLVEPGKRAVEHVAILKIFTDAENVAAWRYPIHRELGALRKVAEDLLYLRSRFQPLPREVHVRLAQDLRVVTETFHLAYYSSRHLKRNSGDN